MECNNKVNWKVTTKTHKTYVTFNSERKTTENQQINQESFIKESRELNRNKEILKSKPQFLKRMIFNEGFIY